jgi:tetratricopeptide (TPR) repeat protein
MKMAAPPREAVFSADHPRYEILEPLESTPGGQLLRVHDRLLGQDVALRALSLTEESAQAWEEFRARFLDLSRLDHPHLARMLDLGRTGSLIFYTRELSPAESSLTTLRARDEHGLLLCLAGLADALGALHAAGWVHGLTAPDHLRVSRAAARLGGARVTDAGLRPLLPAQYLALKRKYIAPEVKAGAMPSPASDLYGLGATLLGALGGEEALTRLARGATRPFRSFVRSLDSQLLDLLDLLVAPDPERRPASGLEVLRAIHDPGWALPDRTPSVDFLLSPLLVGREPALADLKSLLRRASRGQAHAGEIVGQPGMGCSRLLAELGAIARSDGWSLVRVEPATEVDGLRELAAKVELALNRGTGAAAASHREPASPPAERPCRPLVENGSETPRYANFATALRTAVDEAGVQLILLADHAERLPADILAALRYLVTETGGRSILVIATGVAPVGLPDADVIAIGALGDRDLRRLLAPLLTEALNPEPMFAALKRDSGGNPLWIRVLLASWIESGRLRLVHGRPYLDEQSPATIPGPISTAVGALVERLDPRARALVEALAVWGRPLPPAIAAQWMEGEVVIPEAIVITDEANCLRFAADTFGPVILDALTPDRRQFWHAAILATLEGHDNPEIRATHLLGAGRTAEAVRDLLLAARKAQAVSALRKAFELYRVALANIAALEPGEIDRPTVALEAAKLAIRIGELDWAREALATISLPRGDSGLDPQLRFEVLLARAEVLCEQRLSKEAAAIYAEARDLAREVEVLRSQISRVDLEESRNDFYAGHWQAGVERLQPVIAQLAVEDPGDRLAEALNRMATLRSQGGDPRQAAWLALRAARLARRSGDHLLAARAFTNLGFFYERLAHSSRAMMALARARRHLDACPHDGLAASELVHRGNVLMSLRRFDEAEKVLLHARAVRLRAGERGRLPATLIQLGRAMRHNGRLEQAAACYDQALAISAELELPEVHWARANLGELFLHQGELHEAEQLIRQGLGDPQPGRRSLGFKNLGVLLRQQGRRREALAVLGEGEAALARFLPGQRPLAVIQAARVHLDGGDAEAARIRLAEVSAAVESGDPEVRAEYHLARGLVLARLHQEPYAAFEQAAEVAKELGDPTVQAEVLIDSISAALDLTGADVDWIRRFLAVLEDVAPRTDARPVATGLRALRAEVAIRCPQPPAGTQLADDFAKNVLEHGSSSVDALLAQLIGQLGGSSGALVIAAQLKPDGRLSLTPVAAPPGTVPALVRPYRVAAREFDRGVFRQALAAAGGNVPRAAGMLQLPESTFRYRAWKAGLLGRRTRDS